MNKVPRKRGRPPGKKNKKTPKVGRPKGRPRLVTAPRVETETIVEQPVLPWPSLRRVDMELLPRMSALATSPEEDATDREDLNSLQLELETLLSAVAVRQRQLDEQVAALRRCEKKGSRPRLGPRQATPTPMLPSEPATVVLPLPPPPVVDRNHRGPPRGRPNLKKIRADARSVPDGSSRAVKPCARKHYEKNYTPHKFWTGVEPFCGEVSEDSLQLLQDLIRHNQTVVPKLLEEPPLGEHYTSFWNFSQAVIKNQGEASPPGSQSEESKMSTEDTSNDASSSHGGYLSSSIGSVKRKLRECAASIKRSMRGSVDKKSCSGQCPSKVTALLNSSDPRSPSDLAMVKIEEDDSVPHKVAKADYKYETHTPACLDRRLRLTNEASGDVSFCANVEKSSDAVLDELRRAQAELRLLVEHNNQELLNIAGQLQGEMLRQKIISRLRETDDSVVSIYQTRAAGKLSKQEPTSQETSQAWRALSDRNDVLRHLDYIDRAWCKGTLPGSEHNPVLAPAS